MRIKSIVIILILFVIFLFQGSYVSAIFPSCSEVNGPCGTGFAGTSLGTCCENLTCIESGNPDEGGTCEEIITPTSICVPPPVCLNESPPCVLQAAPGTVFCPNPTPGCVNPPECITDDQPCVVDLSPRQVFCLPTIIPNPTCFTPPPCYYSEPRCLINMPQGSNICPPPITIEPISCPTKIYGDANCDKNIDKKDFKIWKTETNHRINGPANSDFNSDGRVDLVDFEIWRRHKGLSYITRITPITDSTPPVTPQEITIIPATASTTPQVTDRPLSSPSPSLFPSPTPGESQTESSIQTGSDVANEDDQNIQIGSNIIWIGNGSSVNKSYTGFRFPNVQIPPKAIITSAHLIIQNRQEQWISLNFDILAEDTDNSQPFSLSNPPSKRILMSEITNHSSDVKWEYGIKISFGDLKKTIQKIVDKPGWKSGNALSIILKGRGGSWGRKFVNGISADKNLVPELVIKYRIVSP